MAPGGVQGPPPWEKVRSETLATPEAFDHDPKLVWEWYDWRRQKIREARPNAAHEVLARWTRERPDVTVVTQNVDGLHERAGTERLVRLHGSIWRLRCWHGCAASPPDWLDETTPFETLPPRCPYCSGLARPAVVWFGEALDAVEVGRAADAAAACDVFLAIGTSAVVYPAAGLLHHAKRHGAFTIEINVEPTPASGLVDVALAGKAEEVLQTLDGAS
jgi:NAD-dependent deacetylase